MDARDVFGIIVRTIGLLLAIYAIHSLQSLFAVLGGLSIPGLSRGWLIAPILFEWVLGILLLFWPNAIVWLSYRPRFEPPEAEPAATQTVRRKKERLSPEPIDFENIPEDPVQPTIHPPMRGG